MDTPLVYLLRFYGNIYSTNFGESFKSDGGESFKSDNGKSLLLNGGDLSTYKWKSIDWLDDWIELKKSLVRGSILIDCVIFLITIIKRLVTNQKKKKN